MSTYRLKNLLSPRSVALVGASPRHGSVGRAILGNIRKAQFKGEFGLVNPRYAEIDGVATVGSIAGTGVCARTGCHHRTGTLDRRTHRRGRPPRRGGCGHRQRRARPRSGFAGGCGGAGRTKIRHAADRPELPRHHDARRQPQRELLRAYAGGGKSGADLAVRRHRRGHGGLGGAARGRLFRNRFDRRPARCRYRRSARLLRAG